MTQPSPLLVKRFDSVYASTSERLFLFVKRHVWSDAAAKDVVQECYIRLWEKMESVTDDERVLPLLRTIALNITIDQVRKNAKDLYKAEVFHSAQSLTTTADEGLAIKEVMKRYREAVEGLPLQQRRVFRMQREDGLSHRAIADALHISPNTVKRHMSEALQSLRVELGPEIVLLAGIILAQPF